MLLEGVRHAKVSLMATVLLLGITRPVSHLETISINWMNPVREGLEAFARLIFAKPIYLQYIAYHLNF